MCCGTRMRSLYPSVLSSYMGERGHELCSRAKGKRGPLRSPLGSGRSSDGRAGSGRGRAHHTHHSHTAAHSAGRDHAGRNNRDRDTHNNHSYACGGDTSSDLRPPRPILPTRRHLCSVLRLCSILCRRVLCSGAPVARLWAELPDERGDAVEVIIPKAAVPPACWCHIRAVLVHVGRNVAVRIVDTPRRWRKRSRSRSRSRSRGRRWSTRSRSGIFHRAGNSRVFTSAGYTTTAGAIDNIVHECAACRLPGLLVVLDSEAARLKGAAVSALGLVEIDFRLLVGRFRINSA